MDIRFSNEAFVKPLLHAIKYPHCAINGVFLCDKKKEKELNIVDAIPLFHSTITLAPMLEIALTQIDAYCKNKNLTIAGYYQANENFSDSNPQGVAFKIGEKIKENNQDSFIAMINNEKLSSYLSEIFIMYQNLDGRWKKLDKSPIIDDNAENIISTLLDCRAYRSLQDFDNHLDDLKQDWRNAHISQLVNQCI